MSVSDASDNDLKTPISALQGKPWKGGVGGELELAAGRLRFTVTAAPEKDLAGWLSSVGVDPAGAEQLAAGQPVVVFDRPLADVTPRFKWSTRNKEMFLTVDGHEWTFLHRLRSSGGLGRAVLEAATVGTTGIAVRGFAGAKNARKWRAALKG